MSRQPEDAGVQTYSAPAMNTTFTLRLDWPDPEVAADAAGACWTRLEELEAILSRFRPDSDISRINRLEAGQSLYIDAETHACLLQAQALHRATGGLFDVSLGAHTWPDGQPDGPTEVAGELELSPDRPHITCRAPGRQLDLGGIGKGFALDRLVDTLLSYRIESALLSAGASTHLAIGPGIRPITLGGDPDAEALELRDAALSASGAGIQGAHVIHPDIPDAPAPCSFRRVWVLAPTAAEADALSTACLLMNEEEIEAFADMHGETLAVYAEDTTSSRIRPIPVSP